MFTWTSVRIINPRRLIKQSSQEKFGLHPSSLFRPYFSAGFYRMTKPTLPRIYTIPPCLLCQKWSEQGMDDVLKYLVSVNIYFRLNGVFSESVTRQFCYWFTVNNPFFDTISKFKSSTLCVIFSFTVFGLLMRFIQHGEMSQH